MEEELNKIINDLEYSAFNLCDGKKYTDLPSGIVESTGAKDTLLIAIRDLKEFVSRQVQAGVSNANGGNKIRWFMQLALKMRDRGYIDGSIYSIDIDAWDEYRVDDEYTPEQAIIEDESNA